MARTTLNIDDDIIKEIRRRSAEEAETIQRIVNHLLRQALAVGPRNDYRLDLQGWEAELQPGVDLLDRDTYLDLLDKE